MSRSTYVGWWSLLTAQLSNILHRELLPVSVGPAITTRGPGRLLSFACCRRFCKTWCVLMYCMLGVSLDLYLQASKQICTQTECLHCTQGTFTPLRLHVLRAASSWASAGPTGFSHELGCAFHAQLAALPAENCQGVTLDLQRLL